MQDNLIERVAMLNDGNALPSTVQLLCDLRDRIAALEADNARLMGLVKEAGEVLNDAFPIVAAPGAGYSEARLNTVSGNIFTTLAKIKEAVDTVKE